MTVTHPSGIGRSEVNTLKQLHTIRALILTAIENADAIGETELANGFRDYALDEINARIRLGVEEHNDAVLARAATMYAGRGGNDPASRACGYIEEFYIDLPAKVA